MLKLPSYLIAQQIICLVLVFLRIVREKGGEGMERAEAKEILCEQLKLLAEVSRKEANKKIGRRPEVLSKLTDSMLALVTRLFF